jgi:hypothetical protein
MERPLILQVRIFLFSGIDDLFLGKDLANPTALLLSGIMMLRHLHLNDKANQIQQGLITTLTNGQRTRDLAVKGEKALSTTEFTDAIIKNLPAEAKSPSVQVSSIRKISYSIHFLNLFSQSLGTPI